MGELKGALIVTPVIVKLLFGLGLGEIRFWVVRNEWDGMGEVVMGSFVFGVVYDTSMGWKKGLGNVE